MVIFTKIRKKEEQLAAVLYICVNLEVMRKISILILALSLVFCVSCSPGCRRIRGGVRVETEGGTLQLRFYDPATVRVTRSAGRPVESPSFSVVKRPEKVRLSSRQEGECLVLSSEALTARIDRRSANVSFFRPDGTPLVAERPGGTLRSQAFLLEDGESLYGLGQHQGGVWDWRGHELTLQNNNMEIALPLVHSSKGYALFWDNYSTTQFSDGPDGMCFSSEEGEQGDYYLIVGRDADAVVAGIRSLTGQAPLSPLWAYGFHQSRERYVSQEELVGVVKRYRELGVPLDGIVQDWRYWGMDNAEWNSVEFRNPAYPEPRKMMDEIHGLHAHALISVWPSFGPKTNIYQELEAIGALLPIETFPPDNGVKVYDPFNPQARDIYWSYMKRHIWDAGLDAWWLDATEPEHKNPQASDFAFKTAAGSFGAMRNAFPLYSCGGVYDHQRADAPERRVLILTRSATVGLQRYGAHCWSGDLTSGWDALSWQIPEALHFSLCGMPYWNSDIGGFFSAHRYPDGCRDPEYRRLYLRWMQFAAFTGMMRSHGTHTPREIFQFGGPGDFDFEAQKECIRLRYLLLPYLYGTAWQVTSAGGSLMRALFQDWPSDPKARAVSDEFLFGRSLLVAPVVTDALSREVYLPEGGWFDFWTGERVAAGMQTVDCPLDRIPLFVRSGTILPVGPDVQYACEKPWDSLQIRVYPGADGSFVLYEDEGDGYGYERGRRSEIRFRWDDAASCLTICAREGSFPGMPAEREFRIVGVRPGCGINTDRDAADVTICYTGEEMTVTLP